MNIRKFKWILAFAGAVVVVLLLRGFAFTSCLIPSTGMENSIFQGERILVNKWSYGLRVPFMSLFSYHRWCESPVRQQDIVVFNNPAGIREPIIDRREIYISRCLGVPGDTLLVDSLFSVISPEAQFNPDKKRLYSYPASKENLITSLMHTLSITNDGLMGSNDSTHVRSFSRYEYYLLEQAMNGKESFVQPLSNREDAEPNPLIVPGKGKFIRVYPWNITLLRNTLVMHEGKQAEIKNDTLYVDGNLHNTVISLKITIGWDLTIPSTFPTHGSSGLSRKTISSGKPPSFGSPKKKRQACLTDTDGTVSSER